MHRTPKYSSHFRSNITPAFTLVELLVVIVVIAVLAAVTTITFAGISQQAEQAAVAVEARAITEQLESIKVTDGSYPTSIKVE